MASNRKEHLRYRYGICLNDGCSKCKSKEVQQIPSRKDLVCEECGKPLRECPPPRSFKDKYGKLLIGGGVVAAAAIVLLVVNLSGGDKPAVEPAGVEAVDVDTIETVVDTIGVDTIVAEPEPVAEEPVEETAKEVIDNAPKGGTKSAGSGITVPFGVYSGPANGLDGEIRVTRSYSLDMRNAAHETLDLEPGDVITRTKFKNGELVGGFWKRGTQSRSFHR